MYTKNICSQNLKIKTAQGFVAEAMLAFQQQLQACFRGDYQNVIETRRRALFYTEQALILAKELAFIIDKDDL